MWFDVTPTVEQAHEDDGHTEYDEDVREIYQAQGQTLPVTLYPLTESEHTTGDFGFRQDTPSEPWKWGWGRDK